MQTCEKEMEVQNANAALIAAIEAVLKADMTGQLNGGGAYMRHVPEAVLELRKVWRSSGLHAEKVVNTDAALFADIRRLMGSATLGTAREVRLAQDTGDHSFVVQAGREVFDGFTLPEAIRSAVEEVCNDAPH